MTLAVLWTSFAQGSPPFSAQAIPAPVEFPKVVALDASGDGLGDLVASARQGSSHGVVALLGDGVGGFGTQQFSATTGAAYDIAAGDLNEDGLSDILIANAAFGPYLQVLLGIGSGSYVNTQNLFLIDDVNSVAAGDWDGDGDLDAVGGYFFTGVGLLKGDGAGSLQPVGDLYGFSAQFSVLLADMTDDGLPDIVAASNSKLVIHRNTGGTFASAPFSIPVSAFVAAVGDLDIDGHLDVAAGGSGVSALKGDGAGGLGPPVPILSRGQCFSVRICDLQRDGKPDVVFTRLDSGGVYFASGDGAMGFAAPVVIAGIASGVGLAAIDFSADGSIDLAAAVPAPQSVVAMQNLTPSAPATVPIGSGTAGCLGVQGIAASSIPIVGNNSFGITITNVPFRSLALLLVGDAVDAAGSDLFGAGVLLHIDLSASSQILVLDARADSEASAFVSLGIPPQPALSGQAFFIQLISAWPTAGLCMPSPFHLSSSRALRVRVL
ncbi:MAG: VCBS repeat-containing protein [Planctomycetes bacterium]|nr:VCBS repeat-containing protein [Planctomycetota bacterium]